MNVKLLISICLLVICQIVDSTIESSTNDTNIQILDFKHANYSKIKIESVREMQEKINRRNQERNEYEQKLIKNKFDDDDIDDKNRNQHSRAWYELMDNYKKINFNDKQCQTFKYIYLENFGFKYPHYHMRLDSCDYYHLLRMTGANFDRLAPKQVFGLTRLTKSLYSSTNERIECIAKQLYSHSQQIQLLNGPNNNNNINYLIEWLNLIEQYIQCINKSLLLDDNKQNNEIIIKNHWSNDEFELKILPILESRLIVFIKTIPEEHEFFTLLDVFLSKYYKQLQIFPNAMKLFNQIAQSI